MSNLTCYRTLIPFTCGKVPFQNTRIMYLSNIMGVRGQICEMFGVCCNKHPVKAPSSLFKKSRLRDLNHIGCSTWKKKKRKERKKSQINDSSCEQWGVWHQTSLPFVWLNVKRRGDECASKYAHSHICITLTFLPQQMVQLNWKHNFHENMMPFNVDWAKQVAVMECWRAGKDFCVLVIEATTLNCVIRTVWIL